MNGGSRERNISFRNIHNGESYSGIYKSGGRYLPSEMAKINHILRDRITQEVHVIDPRVIDIVAAVHEKTGLSRAFDIISGYRCPSTNALLRRQGGRKSGVSCNSLHIKGMAIDLNIPGYATEKLRDIGLALQEGGVGYYPKSNFVHLDCGPVRSW
jgi:uncharacterized protein YcbK (DUF882 family)